MLRAALLLPLEAVSAVLPVAVVVLVRGWRPCCWLFLPLARATAALSAAEVVELAGAAAVPSAACFHVSFSCPSCLASASTTAYMVAGTACAHA